MNRGAWRAVNPTGFSALAVSSFGSVLLGLLTLCASLGAQEQPQSMADRPPGEFVDVQPEMFILPSREVVEQAMAGGVAYLIDNQNEDGSWGGPGKPADGFWSNPYTHQAWTVGTTALSLICLLESPRDPPCQAATVRALRFLLEHPPLQRPSDWDVDNTWGDIYATQALATALAHEEYDQGDWAASLKAKITEHIGSLAKTQAADGGWGYYDLETRTARPSWSTSFMTAAAILGLLDARQLGVDVHDGMLARAVAALERCRLPTGAYTYSVTLFPSPGRLTGINQLKGSLSRMQVGNLALFRAGSPMVGEEQLLSGLDSFFRDHRFLDVARQKPVPHEAYYQNSGYFYFFGHYYAAQVLELLEPAEQLRYRSRLAREVVKTRESDGSMWDFYLHSYHKPYGTAFGVMALRRTVGRE
ncbi:MAG: hypothetical protein ACI9EF_002809 [Pseudohongiellaceae bacterium]|jgi:hypothetical protein